MSLSNKNLLVVEMYIEFTT